MKTCLRCNKSEEPSEIGAILANFVCDYCRLDSLEIGHQRSGVDQDVETDTPDVDADIQRENNLEG